MSSCSKCGKDLSNLPKDITTCPYCGAPLKKEMKCSNCEKDLSTFPQDIAICPYCGTPLKKAAQTKAKKGRWRYVFSGVLLLIPAVIMLFLIPPLTLLFLGLAAVLILFGLRGLFEKLGEAL
jgi:hypothetical protein